MTTPQTLRLIAFALGAALLSTPALAATKRYATFYKDGSGNYGLLIGQDQDAFAASWNEKTPNGWRLTDIEVYQNAAGNVRYDTVWDKSGGDFHDYIGLTEASVVSKHATHIPQGFRVTDLSSYRDHDGVRRYAVSFRPGSGPEEMHLGQTQSELMSTWTANGALGLRITALEFHRNVNGEKRYDTVYGPGTGAHYIAIAFDAAGFAAEVAAANTNGLVCSTFETYLGPNGIQRFDGVFRADTSGYDFHIDETASEMNTTWTTNSGNGMRLFDIEEIYFGTDPSWQNYGVGLAGTLGVPAFTLTGDPVIGQSVDVTIGNSLGATTLCGVFIGLSQASLPFEGGTLLVNPATSVFFNIPGGGLTIPAVLTNNAGFDGLKLYLQVAEADPAAPVGVSLSQGLEITLGRLE